MPVTAAGPVSLPLENLRQLVAASAAFQAWTDSADAAEAAGRVYLVDVDPPADADGYTADELAAMRPLAVVDEFELPDGRPGAGAWSQDRTARSTFIPAGKLLLRFEAEVPPEDARNPAAAKLAFMNQVGAVLQDLMGLGGGDTDYLSVHRLDRWSPYRRSDETETETQGDCWTVAYLVTWGV